MREGESSYEVAGSNSVDSEPSCPVASAQARMKRAKRQESGILFNKVQQRGRQGK